MAEGGSAGAAGAPRYLAEIPFRAARNGRLTEAPYDLPDGARIEQAIRDEDPRRDERRTDLETIQQTLATDRSPKAPPAILADPQQIEYRYCVTVRAANAEDALAFAEAGAKALLDTFAANQMAFELGPRKGRYIKRLDPPNDRVADTELPLDTVGIRTADLAAIARKYDPTGEQRRKGMVFTSNADAVVNRPSIALEGELYTGWHRWDERVRRAAEIYRLVQCSEDETVRFLLSCLALEVLVAHDRTPVLKKSLPTKRERARTVDAVDAAVADLPEDARKRITERVQTTEAQSYTTSATAYLAALSLAISGDDLAWVQRQRGGFVHAGARTDSAEDALRRNDFVKVVGVGLLREMARAVGRAVGDLIPATTFTWLQVWDPGDGGEPTLRVG